MSGTIAPLSFPGCVIVLFKPIVGIFLSHRRYVIQRPIGGDNHPIIGINHGFFGTGRRF
jgi:hypothetical protein